MPTNFLEELVAEWLEYRHYIVKRNERVGPRPAGGYEGELDIVAFNPVENRLVHYETSTDADSWAERERRFAKKFEAGSKFVSDLFEGLTLPDEIEKRAVFAFGSDRNHRVIGGGTVQLAEDLIIEILQDLKDKPFTSKAVPEKYPILRVLQMITQHRAKLVSALAPDVVSRHP